MDQMRDTGGLGCGRHRQGAVHADASEIVPVVGGLERPHEVDHRVGALEYGPQQVDRIGVRHVDRVPLQPVVRRDLRGRSSCEPHQLEVLVEVLGPASEPVEQGGADVTGRPRDDQPHRCASPSPSPFDTS